MWLCWLLPDWFLCVEFYTSLVYDVVLSWCHFGYVLGRKYLSGPTHHFGMVCCWSGGCLTSIVHWMCSTLVLWACSMWTFVLPMFVGAIVWTPSHFYCDGFVGPGFEFWYGLTVYWPTWSLVYATCPHKWSIRWHWGLKNSVRAKKIICMRGVPDDVGTKKGIYIIWLKHKCLLREWK